MPNLVPFLIRHGCRRATFPPGEGFAGGMYAAPTMFILPPRLVFSPRRKGRSGFSFPGIVHRMFHPDLR